MRLAFTLRLLMLVLHGFAANLCFSQSVFQSSNVYKLAVEKDGVFKITRDNLKKTGFNLSDLDPRHIKIFGNTGGMLPQANSAIRSNSLSEIAIKIVGEEDGKFDKQDYILFYAEGPDKVQYNIKRDVFHYENNLYSDKNYYFITIGDNNGKRIESSENLSGDFPVITEFDDYAYHELDLQNKESSGREWYGEEFALNNELDLKFDIPRIVPGSTIKIVSDVMGQSYSNASFKLFLNATPIAEQFIIPISSSRYSLKGQSRRDTISINEVDVNASARTAQILKYQFVKGSGYSQGNLNYVLLNFKRELSLYNSQTIFTSGASVLNPASTFQLSVANEAITIWDVTNPSETKDQSYTIDSGQTFFSTETNQLKRFVAFGSDVEPPQFVGKVVSQNLRGLTTPNLIIITHPMFKAEAERLAKHREAYSNLTVQVVTPQEVYNEFSSGRQDVSALRDFVKYLYDQNPSVLKSLLLFGKGSYDYKDINPGNTNFVATYESRNSLHPLQTYSSDDYFGFLENSEGEWQESPAKNHSLDIGVGRLPVTSTTQAKNVVDKIIQYDTDKKSLGYWRKEIVFVADDGSSDDGFTSLHQYQSNALASLVEESQPAFDTKKLFMGTYKKTVKPNGETVPKMTDDIVEAFERGALIINYTGHGGETQWTDEKVFSDVIISKLENKLYPFLVTATCEFGRQDDPAQTSSAEQCVTLANAGAIGMVTTARPVNATTNFNLNIAFYEALFQRVNNIYPTLGQVFMATKNNSISGVANRNFSLLGDPSLTLALPPDIIKITSVKTENGSDTLKALSKVIVKGQIENPNGEKLTNFNGVIEAVVFDKETDFVTIGRNDPTFNYKQWHNILFRGKTKAINGEVEFEFILPKNISYSIAEGKLSLYGADVKNHIDANGFSKSFKIGGSETQFTPDNTPPEIKLFMGDTTFTNGGITSPNTYLVAKLSDKSGINISDYGIGNSLIAVLDNDLETFNLNSYYVAETDDFTRGLLKYPIKNLKPGRHTLTLKAWDVFNNPATATIEFIVTDGEELVIETFGNFPNPFTDKTTFFFTHNRAGDDLEAHLFIYSLEGNLHQAVEIPITQSEFKVNLRELNNSGTDKKLPAGLYLARITVRSLTNGSKNERVTKLIILN